MDLIIQRNAIVPVFNFLIDKNFVFELHGKGLFVDGDLLNQFFAFETDFLVGDHVLNDDVC
jgi:hypothetical protein